MTNALQPHTSLRAKVLSGLRWSAGLRFFGQLLTWVITIIVMRKLSPQDYGLMGMASIAITYLATLNELGLGTVLIQRKSHDEDMTRQIFSLLLIVNTGLYLLCFFSAPIISSFFTEDRLLSLIRLLAVQFILASFSIIPQSLIDREMLFREKSVVELSSAVAGSLTTLALALAGFGVWALVWGSLSLNLFRTMGLNIVRPYMTLPLFLFKNMRKAVFFGGYVTMTRILWLFYSKSDMLIVGKVLGKQALGFYSVALTLASLPMEKVSGIINQVAFPAFANVQGDNKLATKHFLKAVRVMSFLAFPVLWGISSIAPHLIVSLIGQNWIEAIIPFQIICLVIPLRMINNLMSPTLLGLGHPKINLFNVLTASLVLPSAFFVGCRWGIVGVSISWCIIFPFVFLINLARITRILNTRVLHVIINISKPLFASILMYLTVLFVPNFFPEFHPLLNLTVSALLGTAIYSAFIFLFSSGMYHEVFDLLRHQT